MAPPPIAPDRRRTVWAVWTAATVVVATVAAVVPFVVPDPATSVPALLPATLGLSAGVAALIGVGVLDRGLVARRPVDAEDAGREVTARLVMQVALLEAPALLSVALAAVVGPPWVVLTGAVPALVGLSWVRPSSGRLARLHRAWADPR